MGVVGVVGVGHVCGGYRICLCWVWWVKNMFVVGVVCVGHECIGCGRCGGCRIWVWWV